MAVKKVECGTAKLNICINQGATFQLPMTWREQNEDGTAGDAIDLTGYTARMQVREELEDAATLIELTTENGRITLNDEVGLIELHIAADDTEALDFDSAVYDLELVDGEGGVIRLIEGRVTLQREVTR